MARCMRGGLTGDTAIGGRWRAVWCASRKRGTRARDCPELLLPPVRELVALNKTAVPGTSRLVLHSYA